MAKKRKTRREKELSSQRISTQSLSHSSTHQAMSYTFTTQETKVTTPQVLPSHTTDYGYIISDLRKTALLSVIAIVAQVILFFILHR